MYDSSKKAEMLKSGFWPIREQKDGKEVERMATAMGNLLYRPSLFDEFSLKHGEIHGETPCCIIVFDENDD